MEAIKFTIYQNIIGQAYGTFLALEKHEYDDEYPHLDTVNKSIAKDGFVVVPADLLDASGIFDFIQKCAVEKAQVEIVYYNIQQHPYGERRYTHDIFIIGDVDKAKRFFAGLENITL